MKSYQLCRGTANGEDFENHMASFLEAGFVPYGHAVLSDNYIVQPMVFYGTSKKNVSDFATNTKDRIKVMQAFVDGEEIECKNHNGIGTWRRLCQNTEPCWDWANVWYRVAERRPEA